MKRAALIALLLIAMAAMTAIGHRLGYQEGLSAGARRVRPAAAAPRDAAVAETPVDPVAPQANPPAKPPAGNPPPVAAAPAPAPAQPAPKEGKPVTLQLNGATFEFSMGGDSEPTGDRAKYSGLAILESEAGVTEAQILRMIEWLKMRDVAYSQLSEIKDPAVHAAQGQWTKDYYESLFRSEMTVEQQKKYDELKAAGSFAFRGPPPFSK